MFKLSKTDQRGSIELIILVLVFAIAIGVVAWRVAETYNAQSDAESSAAFANNAPDVVAKYVTVTELGFKFRSPEAAGEITYEIRENAGKKSALIFSSKLKAAKYTCSDENQGDFGAITVAEEGEAMPIPKPAFTKTIGDNEYRYASGLQTICYEDHIMTQFNETIPRTLVESIQEVKQ